MNTREVIRESIGLSVTASRYLLAERMAKKVENGQPILGDMIALVGADILDGAILRHFNLDTPLRRVADGVVDHMSVARVSYEIGKKYPESQPYLAILATRAIAVGGANLLHLIYTGEVTKGNNLQRTTNLATAAFALTAASGNKPLTNFAGAVTSGIAIMSAPSHFQAIGDLNDGEYRHL